jgi:hypothetical protein
MTLHHTEQVPFDLVVVSKLIAGKIVAPQAEIVESSVVIDKLSAAELILVADMSLVV